MSKIQQAISNFPVLTWYQQFAEVQDAGDVNVYADCAICGGKKCMGIQTDWRVFHCFKCDEAGARTDVWGGKANLVNMIKLVERVEYGRALEIIFKMSGIPDAPRSFREVPQSLLPDEAIPMAGMCETENIMHPALAMLKRRKVMHLKHSSYVCLDGEYEGHVILPVYYFGQMLGFEAKPYGKARVKSRLPRWFDRYSTIYTTFGWSDISFCVVTESILDAETLTMNAIGLFGSSLSYGQLRILIEMKKTKGLKTLVWMLDEDAKKKQNKIIMEKTFTMFDNYVVDMRFDPNKIGHVACWDLVKAAKPLRDEFDMVSEILDA